MTEQPVVKLKEIPDDSVPTMEIAWFLEDLAPGEKYQNAFLYQKWITPEGTGTRDVWIRVPMWPIKDQTKMIALQATKDKAFLFPKS